MSRNPQTLAQYRSSKEKELETKKKNLEYDLGKILDIVDVSDHARTEILSRLYKYGATSYMEAFYGHAPDDKFEKMPWGDWQAREME